MVIHPKRRRIIRGIVIGLLVASVLTLPAAGVKRPGGALPSAFDRMSQVVAIRHALAHPEQAPPELQNVLRAWSAALSVPGMSTARSRSAQAPGGVLGDLFNRDDLGVPQNEESVTACRSNPRIVLEGTNDFRGDFVADSNITGWHLSTNGGRALRNEGLLPPAPIGVEDVESGGDPVMVADDQCNLYAADLNYDFVPEGDFFPNGIGVYKSDPQTLARCPGGADPSCWPVRKVVAAAPNDTIFLDKPWMYVGKSGGETVVWVVYSEFTCPGGIVECPPPFTNLIKAVRCDADLNQCTAPILISRPENPSIQFGDVTIGQDGRTYITWEEDNDLANNFEPPENMKFFLRVAPPGSTVFGPPRLIAEEPLNLGFADLHANDFRIATYPKNEVALINGRPRVFLTWEGCQARPLDVVCEEPQIKLRFSDDLGASWSGVRILSRGGDNYFSTISYDRKTKKLAVAWFSNRRDAVFHNRQDVELATVSPRTGRVVGRQLLTTLTNEPEADPLLGGAFIGDYIEVFAHGGTAWTGYNANYRSIQLLGEGFPIPQQDNYLARSGLRGD